MDKQRNIKILEAMKKRRRGKEIGVCWMLALSERTANLRKRIRWKLALSERTANLPNASLDVGSQRTYSEPAKKMKLFIFD